MNESMRVCRASVRVREWYESVNQRARERERERLENV